MFRRLITGAAALALAASAAAQQFPSKPVTLIVPWPAGGVTDLAMRALAEATGKYLGQSVIVDNKPGAAGTLGAGAMLNARPDGYAVTQIPISVFRLPHVLIAVVIVSPWLSEQDPTSLINFDVRRLENRVNVDQCAVGSKQALNFLKGMNHALVFHSAQRPG